MHSNPVQLETDWQSPTRNSPLDSMVFGVVNWTEMAAREHRKTHVVEQTEKVVPLIAGEIAFRQHVCELVFGVNIFDLDYEVQVDSVK